jgi:CheY-like chemotaxis protein
LVLLDLRLPDLSGLAVLGWIRDQEHLRSLRVAVLTASENPNDVSAAHALGATLFLTKPLRVQEIVRLMEMLSDKFWFPAECGPMGQLIQLRGEERPPPA